MKASVKWLLGTITFAAIALAIIFSLFKGSADEDSSAGEVHGAMWFSFSRA